MASNIPDVIVKVPVSVDSVVQNGMTSSFIFRVLVNQNLRLRHLS